MQIICNKTQHNWVIASFPYKIIDSVFALFLNI